MVINSISGSIENKIEKREKHENRCLSIQVWFGRKSVLIDSISVSVENKILINSISGSVENKIEKRGVVQFIQHIEH